MKAILILFGLILLCPHTEGGMTAPVYLIADTYLNSNASTSNFGSSRTGYYNRQTVTPYANQDLLGMANITLIPSTTTYSYIVFPQQGVSVDELDGPEFTFDAWTTVTNWTESTATWDNHPTSITRFLTNYDDSTATPIINALGLDPTEYAIIDITTVVQTAKSNGEKVISVRLVGNPNFSSVPVYLRETPLDSNKPYLISFFN
jgi:hypothetical protein